MDGVGAPTLPDHLFNADWYGWQNPDWSRAHDDPWAHFENTGLAQWRDPSPFVDMTRFREVTGIPDGRAAWSAIRDGMAAPALGVYADEIDLRTAQARFRDGIEVLPVLPDHPHRRRRFLVFYQCGAAGRIGDLMADRDRDWDLLVNYYEAGGYTRGAGEYVFFQNGTKFTAMWNIWRDFRQVLSGYDYVLFLDDDIVVAPGDISRAFASAAEHGLDLAQMSLLPGSHCVWPLFFSTASRGGVRPVNAVEIMMPIISGAALADLGPTFRLAVSGFGLDLLWGQMVQKRGGRAGVIDDVAVSHPKPIDQSGGGFYSYLRRHMINAKTELWTLMAAHDLPRGFQAV